MLSSTMCLSLKALLVVFTERCCCSSHELYRIQANSLSLFQMTLTK